MITKLELLTQPLSDSQLTKIDNLPVLMRCELIAYVDFDINKILNSLREPTNAICRHVNAALINKLNDMFNRNL